MTTTFLRTHGRKLLVAFWLLTPIALLGLHYGPAGQRGAAGDAVARATNRALAAQASADFAGASAAWAEAADAAPDADARVRLALKAQLARAEGGELPEAMAATEALLDGAQENGASDAAVADARAQFGAMGYWTAWLMRLEGAAAEEWEPIADASRQQFRLLAETQTGTGDAHARNLESVIRLQRMDLSELQAQPLPSECENNKDCTGKCKGQRDGRNKPKKKKDARDDVNKDKKDSSGEYERSDAPGW